jgi:hypothetical protein
MTVITTTLHVAPDGAISIAEKLPAGDYTASIEVPAEHARPARQLPSLPFDVDALPTIDLGPWPEEGVSLRREDLYGDDGR